jgi:NADH:ubiquinone oxidoreductase subunit 4 (subunit M)
MILASVSMKSGYLIVLDQLVSVSGSCYTASASSVVYLVSLAFIGYVAMSAVVQCDIKRWIAVYSVVHVNYLLVVCLIIIPLVDRSLSPAITVSSSSVALSVGSSLLTYAMIGHSFIAASMFILAGDVVISSGTRSIRDLVHTVGSRSDSIAMQWCYSLAANGCVPCTPIFMVEFIGIACTAAISVVLAFILLVLSSSS